MYDFQHLIIIIRFTTSTGVRGGDQKVLGLTFCSE